MRRQHIAAISSFALCLLLLLLALPANAGTGPTVFINEIHYDNASTDAGEAIEIAGLAGTNLAGWSIVLYNGSGGAVYATFPLSGLLPDLGGGFGVAAFSTLGLQNGSPDGIALVNGTTVVQFLSYEGAFVAVGGAANGLSSTDIGVVEAGADPVGLSLQLTGSGSTYDDFTWAAPQAATFGAFNAGQTLSGGPPIPTPAALVINEVDYDQPSTDTAEFIEIRNNAASAVDLDAYSVEFVNGNGGGAAGYRTLDLPAFILAPGGYYVVCADATIVANCNLDATTETDFIQNGAPDGLGLRFVSTNANVLVDVVSYEGNTGAPYTEGSGAGLTDTATGAQSISRCPDGADTNQNNVDFTLAAITPGAANTCAPPPPLIGFCGDPATAIHTVQGSGVSSPLATTGVIIEGVVVGDFQASNQLRGFFLQEEDAQIDADPNSSEGIFVFDNNTGANVAVGDVVRVGGTAVEFNGLTELTNLTGKTVCSSGAALPAVTQVNLPVPSLTNWEMLEGMYVSFPQTLTVSGNFTHGRYGEVDLTVPGRLFNPTAVLPPGPAALAMQDLNNRSRIQLDDGSSVQNPLPLPPYLGANGTLRAGDTVAGVIGVLNYAFGVYEVNPTAAPAITTANPRPAQPEAVGGSLRIAAFNVLNYFTTIDNAGPICGPAGGQDCRGADTADEFARQRAKIIAAIHALNADIVGVIELENNLSASIQDLVAGLNGLAGPGVYSYIDTGAIGSDAIRVALIYKPAQVTPVGPFAILDSSVDPRFLDTRNRPALAQTFQENGANDRVTVAVNHLKSKGSACDGDPDTGDLQGNCNATRTLAAEALVDWLAANPTGAGTGDNLIIGDLNAYDQEDPIMAIKAAGYTDLIETYQGAHAYSYVFDGQAGYLDHALASPSLTARVRGATEWHINADEPIAFDYNDFNQPLLYQPDPYRSSDHDPLMVGVCESTPPVVTVTVTPGQLWPPNHQMVNVTASAGVTDRDPGATATLLSVTSNEPDNGLGDGDTPGDIEIIDGSHFRLRAERGGGGSGRIYTVTYQATDACGNVGTGSAMVVVPQSQGKGNGKANASEAGALNAIDMPERIFLPVIVQ
jgi:predicted extracellular nuclease